MQLRIIAQEHDQASRLAETPEAEAKSGDARPLDGSDLPAARLYCDDPPLRAILQQPSAADAAVVVPRPLVVAVHGIGRRYERHAELMSREASRRGFVLLTPCFDRKTYPDYQRLGRRGRGVRSDLALKRLIGKLRDEGIVNDELYLVGYSGGGQFVHRFTMAWPALVTATVSASAGWYTLPDIRSLYPHGIRSCAKLSGVRFDPGAFLRVPMLAAVGTRDVLLDSSLRQSARVVRSQGANRVVRAQTWVESMQTAARERGIAPKTRLVLLDGAGHSFDACVESGLDRVTFDFFDEIRGAHQAPIPNHHGRTT